MNNIVTTVLAQAVLWIIWQETGMQTTSGFVKEWEAIQEVESLEACQRLSRERMELMFQTLQRQYGGNTVKNGTTVTQFSSQQQPMMVISYKCWPDHLDPRK